MSYAPKAEPDQAYATELLSIIQSKIDEHPRSLQKMVGPSEIGGCERKLAWKLSYGGDGNRPGGWAAHKGTLAHAWLDETFKGVARYMPDGSQRFYSDLKLNQLVPTVNGGTLDLYDRLLETVVDWKIPGDGTMDKARAGNLAMGYYVQANVYGLGLQEMGFPVRRVGLAFLAQCGDDLHKKAVFRFWKFEPDVAWAALKNVERISNMLLVASPFKVMEISKTLSDFCQSCPAYVGNGDRRAMCPGATPGNRAVNSAKDPFAR